jgi:hypothetical protein
MKRPATSRRAGATVVGAGEVPRAHKRAAGDSPRSRPVATAVKPKAARAAAKAKLAALELAAAAAKAKGAEPSSLVSLPAGCRARGGTLLAYAPTPNLHGAQVYYLLGILAEASATAATPPSPDGAAAAASGGDAEAAWSRDAAAAVLPAEAVAVAAAAQGMGRPRGLEHVRRLRAMVAAAMPAWEVRRVLACTAVVDPAAQPAAVLRLEPGASREAVRVAFRRLSLLVHPDKNRSPGAAEAFALVSTSASRLLGSAS